MVVKVGAAIMVVRVKGMEPAGVSHIRVFALFFGLQPLRRNAFSRLWPFFLHSRHRGAGASRDGRHDRSPAYAQFDRGADQGGWVRAVLCRPHDGRFPAVRLGLPVVGEHHAGHGRHHRGPHRGPGCGWCNCISAT